MSRDMRPTYAVAAGLLSAVIFSTTAQWVSHRFNAPVIGAPFGGCGAILTGFTVGATVAFWPRRRPKPGCCSSCGYDLTGNVSGRCPECGTGT